MSEVGMLAKVFQRLGNAIFVQPASKQGLHLDPLEVVAAPGEPRTSPLVTAALRGPEMQVFGAALRLDATGDVRAGVLDDLATYYHLAPDVCRDRCVHWEELSVAEWQQRDRSTPEGLLEFYGTVTSWSFDLLWYAYLQTEGWGFPASLVAARFLAERGIRSGRHLDFGSGVGVTAQLFGRLGFDSSLADVSTPLLDFARFRLERRGDDAQFLDLTKTTLGTGPYDVITAFDTLTHVPDVRTTLTELHQLLVTRGWLLTNFDTRSPSDENAWHLYDDDLRLRWEALRAGFRPRATLEGGNLICYQKVAATSLSQRVVVVTSALVLRNPVYRVLRRVKVLQRVPWPTPSKIRRRLRRRAVA